MTDVVMLQPDAQAVKDRAEEISFDLAEWLESNFCECDKRAVAVATLKMGVNLHIEVMGRDRAMKLLKGMFRGSR